MNSNLTGRRLGSTEIPHIDKLCSFCNKPFKAKRRTAMYCSASCRTKASKAIGGVRLTILQIHQLRHHIAAITVILDSTNI